MFKNIFKGCYLKKLDKYPNSIFWIYDKTLEVFRISDEQNIPVNKAADVMAEKRIESIRNIKNAYLGKTNFRLPGQKNRRG